MNYSQSINLPALDLGNLPPLPLDALLEYSFRLEQSKITGDTWGYLPDQVSTDWVNEELSTIEAELDIRKPEGEFVTLLGDNGQPVGFEPAEYGKVELAQDEFNQVDEWADKGLSVSTFLGQY